MNAQLNSQAQLNIKLYWFCWHIGCWVTGRNICKQLNETGTGRYGEEDERERVDRNDRVCPSTKCTSFICTVPPAPIPQLNKVHCSKILDLVSAFFKIRFPNMSRSFQTLGSSTSVCIQRRVRFTPLIIVCRRLGWLRQCVIMPSVV